MELKRVAQFAKWMGLEITTQVDKDVVSACNNDNTILFSREGLKLFKNIGINNDDMYLYQNELMKRNKVKGLWFKTWGTLEVENGIICHIYGDQARLIFKTYIENQSDNASLHFENSNVYEII